MKTLIGVILSILLIVSMPFTSSVMTIEQEEDEHPEYYEVIRYNMRGFAYDKETIRVSYEDAMAIKDAFEGIDSSLDDDKIERKNEVLRRHNLLPEETNYQYSKPSINNVNRVLKKQDTLENLFILLFIIKGTIGISLVNFLSLIYIAPIFFLFQRE
jgi:hypothetical protein